MSLVNIHWGLVSTTGSLHHIFLSHHLFTGRRKIYIDGSLYVDEKRFVDAGSTHTFPLTPSNVNHRNEKHVDMVDVKIQSCRMGTAYRYDVFVNQTIFDKHNLNVAKHLRIFHLPMGKFQRNGKDENETTTTLISCILPDIVHVYISEWPNDTNNNRSSSNDSKSTEGKEQQEQAPPKQVPKEVSLEGTAEEETSVSSHHSCLQLESELGFSMDDDFQGVVHDCILPVQEYIQEGEEDQHFHLYSDVMQDIQIIKLNDNNLDDLPSMTFTTLLQMYPEFKDPTCHRNQKSGKESAKKKKGITRWSKK